MTTTTTFLRDPPTAVSELQEISSVSVSMALWNHFNINDIGLVKEVENMSYAYQSCSLIAKRSTAWSQLTKKIRESIDELPVPKSVADCVGKYVDRIRLEIEQWVAYHHKTIFHLNGNDHHLYRHIPYTAWFPNGTIDYQQTALNLLSSVRLSDVEKFKFLCMYCLENEIASMEKAPVLFADNNIELVEFNQNPLINYWNFYFRNELHKIPVTGNLSLDYFMFRHTKVDNWWAKEYFFDRLSSEEKVQGAVDLINQHGVQYQKLILLKLNQIERMDLYLQKAVDIMFNYSKTTITSDEVIRTWFDLRDLIDPEQFVSIFCKLLEASDDFSISQIWINAYCDFKEYLINYNDYEVLEKIFNWQMKNVDNNELLFTILSDTKADVRREITEKKFFKDYCDKLFAEDKLSKFEQLVKKCLSVEEFEQFKQSHVVSSTYVENACIEFYLRGFVVDANNLLTKLLPLHPDVIQQYKENLLFEKMGRLTKAFLSDCNNVANVVITDAIRTEDLVTSFKKKLIFSSPAIGDLQWRLMSLQLNKIKHCFDHFLASNEDKKELKKHILVDFESKLIMMFKNLTYYAHVAEMKSALDWCLKDDNILQEFKCTLRVNHIFDELLTNVVFKVYDTDSHRLSFCIFRREPVFLPLNEFLNWFFESKCEIKEFKLQKIDSYKNIDMIKTLLKKKDSWYLEQVMKWFFEDDEEEKKKFKDRHSGKICLLV